jgi:glycine/serine hydroxymethyltransferase
LPIKITFQGKFQKYKKMVAQNAQQGAQDLQEEGHEEGHEA